MKEHGICAKCKKSVGCPYADDRIKGCKKFVLEDELELTNEEVLRQCTTEQLAEWIYHERYVWSDGWYEQNGFTVNDVVDFLKQPHNGG